MIRKNNGAKIALRYLFGTINNMTTRIDQALVKLLKRLVYNLARNHKNILIGGKPISKVPNPNQSLESYLRLKILNEDKDAEEVAIYTAPIVLGISMSICKLDFNDYSVNILIIIERNAINEFKFKSKWYKNTNN